jgi:hypothetical protein
MNGTPQPETPNQNPRRAVFGVGIGASALSEYARDPALQRALQEELLENLAVHGRLVFTSEHDLSLFVSAVKSLPSTLAKTWETLLSSRQLRVVIADPESDPGLGEVLDPEILEERLKNDLQLVLLETDQAELLGVPLGDFSALTPGGLVEIGRLSTAARTATILAAKAILDAPLREGENREIEWQERLEPLVDANGSVVIYDKFVGMQTARRYVHRQKSGDGLTWLLDRISMRPGRKVRIITTTSKRDRFGNRYDAEAMSLAFGRLQQSLGRQVGLDLVLVPDRTTDSEGRATEKFGHDRHIRFANRAALALGLGIQSFCHPRFEETIAVARLSVRDARNREERALRSSLRPPAEGWLGWTHQ